MVSIVDAQRMQHAWFRERARATGGRSFSTHHMEWVWLPEERRMLCLFPPEVTAAGLQPALAEAQRRGAVDVEVWLNAGVRAGVLPDHRFERARQLWWMTKKLDDGPAPGADGRITLLELRGGAVWRATARIGQEWAGRALAFVPQEGNAKMLAGIFELEVAQEHRRTGIGGVLLEQMHSVARSAGAGHVVLNATADGQALFASRGYAHIGKGQAWRFRLPK